MADFLEDTRIEVVSGEADRYRAALSPKWAVWGPKWAVWGPNGDRHVEAHEPPQSAIRAGTAARPRDRADPTEGVVCQRAVDRRPEWAQEECCDGSHLLLRM